MVLLFLRGEDKDCYFLLLSGGFSATRRSHLTNYKESKREGLYSSRYPRKISDDPQLPYNLARTGRNLVSLALRDGFLSFLLAKGTWKFIVCRWNITRRTTTPLRWECLNFQQEEKEDLEPSAGRPVDVCLLFTGLLWVSQYWLWFSKCSRLLSESSHTLVSFETMDSRHLNLFDLTGCHCSTGSSILLSRMIERRWKFVLTWETRAEWKIIWQLYDSGMEVLLISNCGTLKHSTKLR